MEGLVSNVWQIHSLFGRVTAGLLIYNQERIRFITEEGIQFDEPISSMQNTKWPFLRMGLGFDIKVNGKKYKFSFAKPNPTAPELGGDTTDQLIGLTDAGRLAEAYKSLTNLKNDKATTKTWKEILSEKILISPGSNNKKLVILKFIPTFLFSPNASRYSAISEMY